MPTTTVPTPDEIWQILERTNATLDKTAARQDKSSREIVELRASQRETDKQIRATAKQLKKTDSEFNSKWGRLMESLVEGDLLKILQEKGVNVYQTYKNVGQRGYGDDFEYDIIAENGQEVVVVEVKTTLRVKDVQDFLASLRKFTTRRPRYRDNTIYGAVAWLRADDGAVAYAEKQGLFVIRATGSSASIVNQENFKPQVFS